MRVRLVLTALTITGAACGGKSTTGNEPDAAYDAAANTPDAAPPDANPAAPTCTITAPATGASTAYDVPMTFMATATDPQDGPLSGASVVWRSNLQVAPLGSGTTLTTVLPVGMNVVTCTATDSTNLTGTATVTVRSRSPFAQINHPGDNETRSAANDVPFVGVARDKEDGALTGASLVWTSSIDGQIGTGGSFNKKLSVGVHTITITATDSSSNTDSVSITLTMTQ